jgi:UPF0176 protein
MVSKYQIITFYEFKPVAAADLPQLRDELRSAMRERSIKGTIILAEEGFNSTVAGTSEDIAAFVAKAESILDTTLACKSSFHDHLPFRRVDVKIKPEIVTLKQPVDMSCAEGTHVSAAKWNELVADAETIVLDARNDYEYQTGTFQNAVNPQTSKFSDLPEFVAANLDPDRHKRVAMFCTGGIRCEKFAPFLKQQGFKEVYQLEGGILKYLETIPAEESLWQGECFVFDDRVSLDHQLTKGESPDHSQTNE